MNKLPAFKYFILLVAGIVSGMLFRLSLIIYLLLLCVFLISLVFVRNDKIKIGLYLGCIILTGCLRVSLAEEEFRMTHLIPEGRDSLVITVLKQKTNPFYIESYIVKADIDNNEIKATLYAQKGMPVLEPGKAYLVSDVKWKPITGSRNPYTFDYLSYAKVHGLSHSFQVQKNSAIKEVKTSKPLVTLAYRIRSDLSVRYLSVLGIEKGSLVNGLLFGMKSEIPSCIADLFRQLGVSHLLAVSGLHVGLIMLIVYQILLSLSIPRIPRVVCVTLFLVFYCILTGGSPSVIRSSLMSVMLLYAPVFQRKYNALNAVAASAVFLLLINPFSLMDLGFQFSYSAVLGILIAYPRIKKCFGSKKRNLVTQYIIDMLAVSFSAALFTSPVALYYFNSLQLASMLLNIIVIPLTFCVMICAILCLPGLYLHGIIPDVILHALDLSLNVFRSVLRLASRSDIWTLHISSYWKPLIFMFILFLLIFICFESKLVKPIAVLTCIIACGIWFNMNSRPELINPDLKKGNMILLRKGRKALIVNTGTQYYNYNDYDRTILPVLDHWGTKDLSLITGDPSLSHSGIIGRIKRDFPLCEIITPCEYDQIEFDHISLGSDTCLNFAGLSLNIFHVNKMLFVEFTMKDNLYKYDNDSLFVNGKGNRMTLLRSLGNKHIQRE